MTSWSNIARHKVRLGNIQDLPLLLGTAVTSVGSIWASCKPHIFNKFLSAAFLNPFENRRLNRSRSVIAKHLYVRTVLLPLSTRKVFGWYYVRRWRDFTDCWMCLLSTNKRFLSAQRQTSLICCTCQWRLTMWYRWQSVFHAHSTLSTDDNWGTSSILMTVTKIPPLASRSDYIGRFHPCRCTDTQSSFSSRPESLS